MGYENAALKKKIKQYSMLVTPALLSMGLADAQIVYHDIDPDVLYKDSIMGDNYTTPFFLDLDGDGVYDVKFAVWSSVQSNNGPNKVNLVAARQYGLSGNAIMGYTNLFTASFCSTALPLYCPSALNLNKSIASTVNFWAIAGTTNLGTLVRYFKDIAPPDNFVGQWKDVTDKYFGLRFRGGDNNLHYGWIRLDVAKSPASITLKDYAYEKQNGVAIHAGDKGNVGVQSVNPSGNFSITIAQDVLTIFVNDENAEGVTAAITNILGQTILTQSLKNNITHIDLNRFGKGVYMVNVHSGDEYFTKKISVR